MSPARRSAASAPIVTSRRKRKRSSKPPAKSRIFPRSLMKSREVSAPSGALEVFRLEGAERDRQHCQKREAHD